MIAGAQIDGVTVTLIRDSEPLLLSKPEVRERSEPMPEDDGIVDMTRYYEDREGTLAGKVWASSWDDYYAKVDQVTSLFDLQQGLDHTLTVTKLNGDVQNLIFRASGPVEIEQMGSTTLFRWRAEVRAADPRWYGTLNAATFDPVGASPTQGVTSPVTSPVTSTATGGATVTLNNAGRSSSPALLTLTGPWTNPWVENTTTGASVYTQGTTLGAADTLIIDSRAKTVALNGVDAPSLVDWARSRWVYVRSGQNVLRAGGASSSTGASLGIQAYDAWI